MRDLSLLLAHGTAACLLRLPSWFGGLDLSAKAVEGPTLALESVDDVERRDGLALGVLRVGDRVANDRLEEELEDAARLVVDEARDT